MKQKVIITIGSTDILLPDDTGAAALLKTLSRGLVGYHMRHSDAFHVTELARPALCYAGPKLAVRQSEHCSPDKEAEVAAALTPKIKALPGPSVLRLRGPDGKRD